MAEETKSSEVGFNFYCYGIVSENKPEATNIIQVFPKDIMYDLNGEINNKEETVVINRTSSDGSVKTSKATSKSTIPARWLALASSNRMSAPDVRKGETVLVFRYGTNDDYYWDVITTETSKRGKETVSYAFKNTDSQDEIKADGSNAYTLTISTKHKFIHLHTAINDGEKAGYDLLINTRDGIVYFKDTRKNIINLNSPADHLTMKINKIIDLEAENINFKATKKLTILTPDMLVNADTYLQNDTSYTLATKSYSISSTAGKMLGSTSEGFSFSNKLIATDLKTNVVNSYNQHIHPGDSGGTTGTPR